MTHSISSGVVKWKKTCPKSGETVLFAVTTPLPAKTHMNKKLRHSSLLLFLLYTHHLVFLTEELSFLQVKLDAFLMEKSPRLL